LKDQKELFLCRKKFLIMSLLNQNNKKKGKKGNKNQKPDSQGSKFIPKPGPGKSGGFSQRPHKAGGTRGS